MRKIKEESQKIISQDCFIQQFKNKLIIHINLISHSRLYKNLILISIPCSAFFLFFLEYNLIIEGLIFLIVLFAIIVFWAFKYFYYRNQKHEWIFDKTTKEIIFSNIFAHFKKEEKINFSEIQSLIYQHNTKYWDPRLFDLSIVLHQNKIYNIYVGEKFVCEDLGNNISKFMGIPLKYTTKMKIHFN
ncbi:MAG: hypothetical protein ACFE8L_14825 [Candidatus Hodarchaeota archaeon]